MISQKFPLDEFNMFETLPDIVIIFIETKFAPLCHSLTNLIWISNTLPDKKICDRQYASIVLKLL